MIHIAQPRKLPRQPWRDGPLKRPWYIHAVEFYSAVMEEEMVSFTEKQVTLIMNMLSQKSPVQKNIYHGSFHG